MLNPLTWFTGGWQGYAAVAVVAAGISAVAVSMPYRLAISNMERDWALSQSKSYEKTLEQLVKDADRIHNAASTYHSERAERDAKFAAISRDFRNAIKSIPLPDGCEPPPNRLRFLTAAVAEANAKTGHGASPAVPAHP